MADDVVLGLDIGGSKTHGVCIEGGRVTREVRVGSANLASVGAAEAGRQLDRLLRELDRDRVAAVCAGAAGADTPEGRQRLADLIAARLPGARIEVVHDTRIILAAAGLEHGIVVISGTGSAAWGRRADGQEARAGGWGYLLGDEGSGYGLARDAVRQALAEFDRGLPGGTLTERLVAACGLQRPDQLLDQFYARPERRFWADLAGLVVETAQRGDETARGLVEAAAGALADLAGTVALRLRIPGPVVLAGGLVRSQPLLQSLVRARLLDRGLDEIRFLDIDPAHGAAVLAARLLATSP